MARNNKNESGVSNLQKQVKAKPKGKAGRKITKDVKNTCTNINVAIPNELYNKWKEIKKARGSNLTQYVTDLIQKDMNENYDKYKQIISMLNDL